MTDGDAMNKHGADPFPGKAQPASGPDAEGLRSVYRRRVVFVTGKGGVGKTTVTLALGMAARRLNKTVLLVETGDSDALGRLCLNRTLSETPENISPALWGARVHPKSELEAYIRAHVGSGFISRKIIQSRLFSYLFDATPGLREMMSLGRIWRWEREKKSLQENRYDLILVDAPATGHAMGLLSLPDQLVRMIRVGPVANQIRELQRLFKHPQKTCLVIVTLPEELPVNEALELYAAAEDDLRMPVALTLVNGVYPRDFSGEEERWIDSWKSLCGRHDDTGARDILDAAFRMIRRRALQQPYIDQVQAKTLGRMKEIPFYFTSDLTPGDIEALSRQLTLSSVLSSRDPSHVVDPYQGQDWS